MFEDLPVYLSLTVLFFLSFFFLLSSLLNYINYENSLNNYGLIIDKLNVLAVNHEINTSSLDAGFDYEIIDLETNKTYNNGFVEGKVFSFPCLVNGHLGKVFLNE